MPSKVSWVVVGTAPCRSKRGPAAYPDEWVLVIVGVGYKPEHKMVLSCANQLRASSQALDSPVQVLGMCISKGAIEEINLGRSPEGFLF